MHGKMEKKKKKSLYHIERKIVCRCNIKMKIYFFNMLCHIIYDMYHACVCMRVFVVCS